MRLLSVVAALAAMPVLAHQASLVVYELPFSFDTRQPIIQLRVNGGAPVPFVVDTGASFNVIETTLPIENLKAGTDRTISGGGEGSQTAQFVNGLTLESGPARWSDQSAARTSLGFPDRKHYAGLIGAPVLSKYAVQFAFAERKMRLLDRDRYAPPAGADAIPFELEDGLPVIHVRLDTGSKAGTVEARVMVDTGAAQAIELNRPFVDKHDLTNAMTIIETVNRPAGIGTPTLTLRAEGARLLVGKAVIDKPRVGLSRATSGSSARSERDGIIGNDVLQRFVMTVDYKRRVIVLQ